jgi:hypothetical protein
LPRSKSCYSLAPKDAGQWLNKNAIFKGDFVWQYKYPLIYIDPRNTEIFGKSPWVEISPSQSVAKGMKTVQTVLAGITGDMMGDEDPVTDLVLIHPFTNLNNLSCNLMTEYPRSFLNPIPFHDIATADTTCQHLDQ